MKPAIGIAIGCGAGLWLMGCSQHDSPGAAEMQRFTDEVQASHLPKTSPTNPISEEPAPSNLDQLTVDRSFKLGWDEVTAPDVSGPEATRSLTEFIAANGWQMQKEEFRLDEGLEKTKPFTGLPWRAIQSRTFPGTTHGGILYVILRQWKGECNGVAYNPQTNWFPRSVGGFKPLGNHWYAWMHSATPGAGVGTYEGEAH